VSGAGNFVCRAGVVEKEGSLHFFESQTTAHVSSSDFTVAALGGGRRPWATTQQGKDKN